MSSSVSKAKEPCKYGSACYRKNPHHLEQFSHPSSASLPKRAVDSLDDMEGASSSSHPSTSNSLSTSLLKKLKVVHEDETKPQIKLSFPKVGDIKDEPEDEPSTSFKPKTELLSDDQPGQFGFHLTKVYGIHQRYNQLGGDESGLCSVSLKDILNESTGELVESAQFSYMYEVDWLVEQYPKSWQKCPLYLVQGVKPSNRNALADKYRVYKQIIPVPVVIADPFGTHHTKMMLLHYTHGLRVVIHTANMLANDWRQKTQGVWISPIFPPLDASSVETSESNFKADLVEYLKFYGSPSLNKWVDIIQKHNMSAAKVFLIASVPGRHRDAVRSSYGHLKLRKILGGAHGPLEKCSSWPVISQFSSIGSLGPDADKWLRAQFISSLAKLTCSTDLGLSKPVLKCIFPTVDNVRLSLEGYIAGANIPYSARVDVRQQYLHAYFHQWKSSAIGRSEASPHIKTYCRPNPENKQLAWFLLTSANLSKAAWGELQVQGSQLAIRSYELGVLFLPKLLCDSDHFTIEKENKHASNYFVLPFDTPLTPYGKQDKPWTWDTVHKEKPDRHGRSWEPDV